MKRICTIVSILLFLLLCVQDGQAHEIRPAYLEIKESAPDSFQLIWKVPMLNGMVPIVQPDIIGVDSLVSYQQQELGSAFIKKYRLNIEAEQLAGSHVVFHRLEQTLIDVLVYVEYLDGTNYSLLAQPSQPTVQIPQEPTFWTVAYTYVVIGVEHILLGIDHLLFVLCLILIIPSIKLLIQTVTAFTIAHSLTLIGSTLGYLSLPGPPVEAIIALSIVFLAREYILSSKGIKSISAEHPWIVAFVFGLLHGFGFAGALSDVGLPQRAIASALLFFNIGVELGQLIFVLVLVLLLRLLAKNNYLVKKLKRATAYMIGGISFYWLIERIVQF